MSPRAPTRRILIGLAVAFWLFSTSLLLFSNALTAKLALVKAEVQAETDQISFQDFDLPATGLSYTSAIHVAPPASGPIRLPGGPSGQGSFLRLAFGDPIPNQSSIAFDRATAGASDQVVVDFDFRMTPGSGRADGFGVALLNTAVFGVDGAVEPQPPHYAGEEPNFTGSVGIGFDIHQATDGRPEISNNHLSVHFDGKQVQDFDTAPFDLASGQWLHARLLLNAAEATVSVVLSQCGADAIALIDQLPVPGLAPYEGRPYFIARSGGESADHDIDNVFIQHLAQGVPPIPIPETCGKEPGTFHNFDNFAAGTPFSLGTHLLPPSPSPTQVIGGPTGIGNFLRLTYGNGNLAHNTLAFDRTNPGPYAQVVAEFAFRIRAGTGRADGLGFALLNTATYGNSGVVEPVDVAEEPNFAGSLGVGFDIYQSNAGHLEPNDNHVSIHYNGVMLKEIDVRNAVDLAEGEWIHARIIVRAGAPYGDLSVILSQCGQPAHTVVDHFKVPGLAPYEGRAYFAARSGGLTVDHDIDDVSVRFLHQEESLISFVTGCHEVNETAGETQVTVNRIGNLETTAMVNYATIAHEATVDGDYGARSGTLIFAVGESSKSVQLSILDDDIDDAGHERFVVSLSGIQGAAGLGGPQFVSVKIVDDEAARREGYWHDLRPSQVVPIHAALLPTGQVMYWDRHDHEQGSDANPRLFDPVTGAITATAAIPYDIFCSGYAFLENGHLLVAGGHRTGSFGEEEMSIYDPFNDQWTRQPDMNAGRWYPTALTLATGDVLVMGGSFDRDGAVAVNTIPQVWEVANQRWRTLTGAKHDKHPADLTDFPVADYYPDHPDYYPFLFVAPNGRIFNAGPQQMGRYLDPAGVGHWSDLAASLLTYRDYGSAVMYDTGKVLITGGNPRDPQLDVNPTLLPSASTQVIDLNAGLPVWRDVGSMTYARRHLNTTLLPDGRVFANGGSRAAGFDEETGAVLAAELWDPVTEQWHPLAAQQRYRGYHSIALLLPDGRVLSGGGGHPNPLRGAQHNFEIYSPPYLFKGARPTIAAAPDQVHYGESFTIETPDSAEIADVVWLRLSAVTHAFNQSQRFNRLPFSAAHGQLTATAPAGGTLAPPGHYMLFLLNAVGVPSIAKIIQLQSRVVTGPGEADNHLYLPVISR